MYELRYRIRNRVVSFVYPIYAYEDAKRMASQLSSKFGKDNVKLIASNNDEKSDLRDNETYE